MQGVNFGVEGALQCCEGGEPGKEMEPGGRRLHRVSGVSGVIVSGVSGVSGVIVIACME